MSIVESKVVALLKDVLEKIIPESELTEWQARVDDAFGVAEKFDTPDDPTAPPVTTPEAPVTPTE